MSKARGLADLGNAFDDGALSNRNLIINGAMQVAQRGTSATGVSNGYRTSDRWYLRRTASGVTFDSDVASGVLTCDNPSAATGFDLRHGIEWEDRFYGKTMTLTFTATTGSGTIHVDATVVDGTISATTSQEFCHLTGTTTDISAYEGSGLVKNGNNYTIVFDVPSDADVSFTPDMLRISIGNTSAASQSITLANVQLEVGDTATPFEHRSYGDELARCQRYCYRLNGNGSDQTMVGAGFFYNTTATRHIVHYPVTMRGIASVSANGLDVVRDAGNDAAVTLDGTLDESIYSCGILISGITATTVGEAAILRLASSTSAYIEFDAEL